MRAPFKLPDDILPILIKAYEVDLVPIAEIARWAGCSRNAVYKFFKKHGVSTLRAESAKRDVTCDSCGKGFVTMRSKLRRNKKNFCSDVCYFVYLENSGSLVNRHKQRIARMKVSKVFDLKPEHVVHHKDGNHHNTMLSNFMVFANQSDHIRFHHQERQGEVTVMSVWDGF